MQNCLINSLTSPTALPRLKLSSQIQYFVNFSFSFLYKIIRQKTLPFVAVRLGAFLCHLSIWSTFSMFTSLFYTCLSFESPILLYSSPLLSQYKGNEVKSERRPKQSLTGAFDTISVNPTIAQALRQRCGRCWDPAGCTGLVLKSKISPF